MSISTNSVQTISLGCSCTDPKEIVALVYGELVKLALHRIEHHHSDLYHDALWLSELVSGAGPWSTDFDYFTFLYVIKSMGTGIAINAADIDYYIQHVKERDVYTIAVIKDSRRRWTMAISKSER